MDGRGQQVDATPDENNNMSPDMWRTICQSCEEFGSNIAYATSAGPVTYREVLEKVQCLSVSLGQMLSEFDFEQCQPSFSVLMPNCPTHVDLFLAAAATRAKMVCLNHRLKLEELQVLFERGTSRLLIASSSFGALLGQVAWASAKIQAIAWVFENPGAFGDPHLEQLSLTELYRGDGTTFQATPVKEDTQLQGFFTSGTTGVPKSVSHTHMNVHYHSLSTIRALNLKENDSDVWGHFGPLFHVGTPAFVWISVMLGARQVFHENQFQFMEVAAMMADDRVSIVKLMPTILKYLLSAEKTRSMRFENLKWVLTGGMKPTADVIKQTKEVFGCQFIQGYGMTEATVHCSFKNESLEPMEDGMTVLPGLDLRVLDEADEEVSAGTVGEISIRGPTVFAGYDNNVEANAKAFTASGFFRSGDLGYKNEKGQLYISGRSKDMIIVGGENVFAVEVEQVIQRISGILRSAVFGGPDEALGEVVHAALMLDPHGPLVNLRDDEIEQKLCRTCSDSLAAYKVPVAVHVWRQEEFPMTGSGKPKKQEIRKQCLAQHEDKPAIHLFASKEAAVIGAVASVLGRDVTDEDYDVPFMDLNMASMEFTRVINLLAGTLQGELSPTLLFENDCLADLLKYIESREDLVLVQDRGDTEPPPDLLQLAVMDEQPENKWGQWHPICLVLQLLSLIVRPLVLTAPVMFVAWAGLLWMDLMENRYLCPDCYWTLIFLPLIYPISILLLLCVAVVFKWLLIGQVRPGVIPLWSPSYYRWLTVYNLFQSLDGFLAMFRGTPILIFFYNRCGAHISYQAELHTSNLTDVDLLRIRQGAVVDRACNIQPGHVAMVKGGHVILGRVVIERDCYMGYGATIGPTVTLEPGSQVRPLQAVSASQPLRASPAAAAAEGESLKKKFLSPPWDFLAGCLLYYIASSLVVLSVTAGAAVMSHLPVSSRSHIVVLLPLWAEGVTGTTTLRETAEFDIVFWTILPAVIFYVVPQAYFVGVVLLKHLIVGYTTEAAQSSSRVWKQWLYIVLIDCPLFRLATQLTVMSHITKLQFRLLGCCIGSRAYFCAPFIPDPELVEIGDDCIVAGNVALLTTSLDHSHCQSIRLKSNAIVANTVVLGPGVRIDEHSIVGDGVCVPAGKELPEKMVAVRDNSEVMAYILMKRSSVSTPPPASFLEYTFFQVLLFILQLFLCVGLNVPGYIAAGLIADAMSAVMPVEVGTWPFIPVLMLVIMTSKILLIPVAKWLIACRFRPREVPLFGFRYVIWIAFEAVLFDADVFFLQSLCGTTFLAIWYRLMGARVGSNVCIMGSSVGCEYDLKHVGNNSVVNHSSLLFSHSVEKGTLIFRRTYLEDRSELGINCVAEAGARVKVSSTLLNGQVAHNADVDEESSKGRKNMRMHSDIVGTNPAMAEVSDSLHRGYRAVRNRQANERAKGISSAFQQTSSVGPGYLPQRMSYPSQEAQAVKAGRIHEVCMNLDDFEHYARDMIAGPCFEYYKGGATDEWTLKENRSAFEKYRIIPRVLIPVTSVDMRCSFFGIDCRFPVMIAPSAMHGQAHPDAEKATARAALRAGSAFTLSSLSNMSMEDVANAVPTDHGGRPKGLMFQLYVFKRRDITELIVKKAEALGYKALCLTVDAPITGRRERDIRTGYATSDAMGQLPNITMLGNAVNQQLVEFEAQKDLTLDWSIIAWLKSVCNLPIIAKGIMHPLDAREAIKAGAAAIVVSNHGGRQLDSVPATIDVLPAIAEEVRGQIPVFIDGGFRRGTDIFKAIGLGASAVMFARPAVYALAVGGEQGVSRMMRLLYDELETTMKLAGCTSLSQIRLRILSSAAGQGFPLSVA
ncbi:GLO5 [Symbiodinium sp. KB8]|nr:GLO5 [Symbiodinium sp. KB8]